MESPAWVHGLPATPSCAFPPDSGAGLLADDGPNAPQEPSAGSPSPPNAGAEAAGDDPGPQGAAGTPVAAQTGDARELALRRAFKGRKPVRVLHGRAAYYHDALAGNRTASGVRYDPGDFTAAHKTLPFGSVLRVRRTGGGEDVYVRVTDRGPFGDPRLIVDLSRAAAAKVGLLRVGVANVRVEVLTLGEP